MGESNMKIQYIEIEKIRFNPENPNPHSEEKIKTLAANIKEFGLLHPITVKCVGEDVYEVVAGEGRLRAFQRLYTQSKRSIRWRGIPCIEVEDTGDYLDWGRRLSENRLRSFSCLAECRELANMRAHGKTWDHLGEVFGISRSRLEHMVAIGSFPDSIFESLYSIVDNGIKMTMEDVRRYVLPLRVLTGKAPRRGGKKWEPMDYTAYDYREVEACFKELANGKLDLVDLPVYSAERCVEVSRKAAEKEIGEKTQRDYEQRIRKAGKEYREKIRSLAEDLEYYRKVSGEEQKAGAEVEKRTRETERKIADLEERLRRLPEEIIGAEMDAGNPELKALEEKNKQEKKRLGELEDELRKREARIRAEEERLELERDTRFENERIPIEKMLMELDGRASKFYRALHEFRVGGYWQILGKEHFLRVASNLNSVGEEMRKLEDVLKERGLIT
jgi:ParB/RepB/Spo0J family partition protein